MDLDAIHREHVNMKRDLDALRARAEPLLTEFEAHKARVAEGDAARQKFEAEELAARQREQDEKDAADAKAKLAADQGAGDQSSGETKPAGADAPQGEQQASGEPQPTA